MERVTRRRSQRGDNAGERRGEAESLYRPVEARGSSRRLSRRESINIANEDGRDRFQDRSTELQYRMHQFVAPYRHVILLVASMLTWKCPLFILLFALVVLLFCAAFYAGIGTMTFGIVSLYFFVHFCGTFRNVWIRQLGPGIQSPAELWVHANTVHMLKKWPSPIELDHLVSKTADAILYYRHFLERCCEAREKYPATSSLTLAAVSFVSAFILYEYPRSPVVLLGTFDRNKRIVSFLLLLPGFIFTFFGALMDNVGPVSHVQYELDSATVALDECIPKSLVEELSKGGDWENLLVSDHIQVGQAIGHGAHGNVRSAIANSTEERAVKFIPTVDRFSAQHKSEMLKILHEAKTLRMFKGNNNVLESYGVGTLGGELCLVTELMDMSLARWIQVQNVQSSALFDRLHQIATDIANGCKAISATAVHCDLTPCNVLVRTRSDGGLDVRIADFGLAKVFPRGQAEVTSTDTFPLLYSPLEVIHYGKYSEASDVFSYATLLYEIFNDMVHPFIECKSEEDVVQRLESVDPFPSVPEEWPNAIRAVIGESWHIPREDRGSFVHLLHILRDSY